MLTSKKALRTLVTQAQKTKLVLSSNREALFKVEALHDDKDFSRDLACTERCAPVSQRGLAAARC